MEVQVVITSIKIHTEWSLHRYHNQRLCIQVLWNKLKPLRTKHLLLHHNFFLFVEVLNSSSNTSRSMIVPTNLPRCKKVTSFGGQTKSFITMEWQEWSKAESHVTVLPSFAWVLGKKGLHQKQELTNLASLNKMFSALMSLWIMPFYE